MNTKEIHERIRFKVDAARKITRKAEDEGRPLTAEERSEVEEIIVEATELKHLAEADGKAQTLDALGRLSGGGGSNDLYGAFKSAGWKPGTKVSIPATTAFKTVTFDTGDLESAGRERFLGIALGADRRKVYEVFPTTPVDAGATSVEVFRQTSRTLASSDYGWVHRAIDSTGAKIETASAFELVQTALQMVATVQSGIPNIMLLQDNVRSIVNADCLLSYQRGLEDLVSDAFNAATIATGSSGSDLTGAAMHAKKDLAALGYNGTVLLVNPTDYVTAALKKGTAEVFARPDPLQTFELVQVPLFASGTAYLVDPSAAARMYISGVQLASFEENAGKTNTTTVRLEGSALFNIERAAAIVKLASTA
jgi:hypothetical protein